MNNNCYASIHDSGSHSGKAKEKKNEKKNMYEWKIELFKQTKKNKEWQNGIKIERYWTIDNHIMWIYSNTFTHAIQCTPKAHILFLKGSWINDIKYKKKNESAHWVVDFYIKNKHIQSHTYFSWIKTIWCVWWLLFFLFHCLSISLS